jgi:hypothetical protein
MEWVLRHLKVKLLALEFTSNNPELRNSGRWGEDIEDND